MSISKKNVAKGYRKLNRTQRGIFDFRIIFSGTIAISIFLNSMLGLRASNQTDGPPNVLVVLVDNFGYGDLGFQGSPGAPTPFLDRLAREGVWFSNYITGSHVAASRASFLTGMYPQHGGVGAANSGETILRSSSETIGEVFAANGYTTRFCGEWVNGKNWPHCAENQGFREVIQQGYVDDLTLLSQAKTPFFAVVTESLVEKNREGGGAEALDIRIEKLAKSVNWENGKTILVVASERGPVALPDLGSGPQETRFNAHLFGGAGSLHEGGLRVPCLLVCPGLVAGGAELSRLSSPMDLLPSLQALCKLRGNRISSSDDERIDWFSRQGLDFSPVLREGSLPMRQRNRILLSSRMAPEQNWKQSAIGIRTDRWLAVRDSLWCRDAARAGENGGWELYDLLSDPFQQRELSEEYPYVLGGLRADCTRWQNLIIPRDWAPVYLEIGHTNWPEVSLVSVEGRLRREENKKSQSLIWRVKVVSEGSYQVRFPERISENLQLFAVDKDGEKLAEITAPANSSAFFLSEDTTEIWLTLPSDAVTEDLELRLQRNDHSTTSGKR